MKQNTEVAETSDVYASTGSLTTISIRISFPPAEDGGTGNFGIAAIGSGTPGTIWCPNLPVTMTYYYQGTPIPDSDLGTYFSPQPPTSISLTGPNIRSTPVQPWNVTAHYTTSDFTAKGCGNGQSGPVCSSLGKMVVGDDDVEE